MTTENRWSIIGPGGGGTHYFPTISPHNSDIVLTCSDMTGAYITYDNCRTWREFNLRIRVDAFLFDPVDPNVIYAGSCGLFRSEDCGRTWRLVLPSPERVIEEIMVGDEADNRYITDDGWPGGKVQTIYVDPEQNGHVYAGVNPHGTLIDVKQESKLEKLYIYYSDNGAKSWKQIDGVEGGRIICFFVDPSSPKDNRRLYAFCDTGIYSGFVRDGKLELLGRPDKAESLVYAACGMNKATGKPVFYVTTPPKWIDGVFHTGVYKSTDCGSSWVELKNGLSVDMAGPESGRLPEYKLLSTGSEEANIVYMTVNHFPGLSEGEKEIVEYSGIFKSEDEGETWKWVLKGLDDRVTNNNRDGWREREIGPLRVGPPSGLGICPTKPEICYATDSMTIYRTMDGGKSWEQVYCDMLPDGTTRGRGMEVTTAYGVHFDPFDQNHIVISYTDIGMFDSLNRGYSWRHAVNGVPRQWRNTCYWMVFDPDVKGRAWSVWGYSHDLPRRKMFSSGGHFDMRPGGICRTEDGLKTWQVSYEGMPENCVTTHIVLDPASPAGKRTLYAAAFENGVYKSTDDGYTWTPKNNGLGKNPFAWRLTLLPDGTLYVIMCRGIRDGIELDGELYKSVDGAEHWEKVALPEGVNAPNDLAFDPSNPSRMYLACWPRIINGRSYYGGVYVTDDGGKSWNCVFDQSAHAYSVTVDEQNPSTVYMVSFDSAAYRSDDKGRTWKKIGGYNFKWGHRVVIDPLNRDMIYITTYGSSVWYGPAHGIENAFEDIYPIK